MKYWYAKHVNIDLQLKQFDKAQKLLEQVPSSTQALLVRKRADWARSVNQPKQAAQMYVQAGEYKRAIDVMVENGWTEM